MSTVTDQPTPDSGGLAPDTVVTPTRGSGARKLPVVLVGALYLFFSRARVGVALAAAGTPATAPAPAATRSEGISAASIVKTDTMRT